MKLVLIFIGIVTLALFGLSIFGLLYKKSPDPVAIVPNFQDLNKTCLTEQVNCDPNLKGEDCNAKCREAQEGQEMSCVTLNRYTTDQKNNYGQIENVCAPANATLDCNEKLGGIKVWSGWSDPDRMEWDCLCSYPDYAGGPNCGTINPGICQGGTFTWDVTSGIAPSYKNCTCPSGTTLMYTNDGKLPVCASADISSWYADLSKSECSPPCANSGVCITNNGVPTCQCVNGWSGTDCTTPPTSCTLQCANGGSCVMVGGTPICNCINGWSGSSCTIPTYCKNGTTDPTTGQCVCTTGYGGPNCDLPTKTCTFTPFLVVPNSYKDPKSGICCTQIRVFGSNCFPTGDYKNGVLKYSYENTGPLQDTIISLSKQDDGTFLLLVPARETNCNNVVPATNISHVYTMIWTS